MSPIRFSNLSLGQHFRLPADRSRYEVLGNKVGKKISQKCYIFASKYVPRGTERYRVGIVERCLRSTKLIVEPLKHRKHRVRSGRGRSW